MSLITSYTDIEKLRENGELSSAEEKLISNCKAGTQTQFEDGSLPSAATDTRKVSANLLRYLILGGCKECPTKEVGVVVTGAYVTGHLELHFAKANGATGLLN